ncbi:methylated-DNA--[protein]-cysteine S-methyltransferase [Arenibaculum sp.]|jgi:methylated-DNA-[protein]-cysteine S-methyltransferase|uniref:methylated-DNA--[protein]-cysteine S-methyltransferase n=1 Tax=Arenibaculum sp. TaxID=2865862 RepID=UPI002E15996F|nr:methylated-DNA--[protein]-cysteine S-methyltransferase [Arenibaculum sp.]
MARITIDSPFGPLTLTASNGALTSLGWGPVAPEGRDPVLEEAARQIEAYFAGRRTDFDLPLRPAGTPFRLRVWEAMSAIPYGRTRSYGEIARELGSAARAVGGACGANPIPIVIPCHRVLAAGGREGGYSGQGGLVTKHWLLGHERSELPIAAS